MSTADLNRDATLDIRSAIAMNSPKAIGLWLDAVGGPAERSHQLAKLSKAQWHSLGELLDESTGPDILEGVDPDLGATALSSMAHSTAGDQLAALDSDHASDVLRRLDPAARDILLSAAPLARANVLRGLLEWPAESAAAHMVPETLTVERGMTAAGAIAAIRGHAAPLRNDARIGAYIYVIDPGSHLVGVVPFRNLVLADAERPVSELMNPDVVTVSPTTDVELAAQRLIDHDLLALPVVDADRRLLGIITADHAADIVEEEATEDAERQGGSQPLEVPYLRASPVRLWRKRIIWLLVLFLAEAYTGTVLRHFEEEMEAVVALAFFIPLLIGTGGNTGTQITTTLVRAMATGQVRFRDVPLIVAKELTTGMLIAITMAAAAVVRAWTLGVGPQITVTVSLTVAAIVLWSSFVASVLPPLLKKLRVDPAVVSAPMIATVVDGTGLIIYFMIAHLTLPQLAGL